MAEAAGAFGETPGVIFKPIYFTFEPPQPAPGFLSEYGNTLSIKDLQEIVPHISEQTIRAELEAGRLPGNKIGRQWVIPKCAFIAYLHGKEY